MYYIFILYIYKAPLDRRRHYFSVANETKRNYVAHSDWVLNALGQKRRGQFQTICLYYELQKNASFDYETKAVRVEKCEINVDMILKISFLWIQLRR